MTEREWIKHYTDHAITTHAYRRKEEAIRRLGAVAMYIAAGFFAAPMILAWLFLSSFPERQ